MPLQERCSLATSVAASSCLETSDWGPPRTLLGDAAVILLVRHGQTEANVAGLLLGRSDPPLTDMGRVQARALGTAVSGAIRVVSSPLVRARETAWALGLPAPVEVDERWLEVDYGDYEGEPLTNVPSEVWGRWRANPAWRPPGGESLADVGTA